MISMKQKKAQMNTDFFTPTKIISILGTILGLIVLLFVLMLIMQVYKDLTCSEIIEERDTYNSQLEACNKTLISLNESINNCSNLIQEQIDTCDDKIKNATNKCEEDNQTYQNYIVVNKIFFLVYNIAITLYFFLSINLFKIVLKIGFKKKWEKLIFAYERIWLVLKIVFWVLLTLFILASILTLLFSNPI